MDIPQLTDFFSETDTQSTPQHVAVPIGSKMESLNSLDKKLLRSIRRDLYARQYIRREGNRARKTYIEYRKRLAKTQLREPIGQALSQTIQNGLRSLRDKPETARVMPATTRSNRQGNNISLKPFEYARLPHTDSIRLLILEPGEPPDKLVFRMEIPRLTCTPRAYTAVSYVWGDANDTVNIFSSEGTLGITRNLYDILHKLRMPDEARRIWADAICINQADVVERGQQVRQMGRIYGSAGLVAVWLGRDDEGYAFRAFCAVSQIASGGQHEVTCRRPAGAALAYFFGRGKLYYADSREFSVEDSETRKALFALFLKPWFTRVWCIQEVALAKLAIVHWGDFELSWKWLGLAAARFWNDYRLSALEYNMKVGTFELALEPETGIANADYMYRVSRGSGAYSKPSLLPSFLRLLYESDGFRSTDPRDLVYGLLGLPTCDPDAGRKGQPFIEPDYSLSREQVYLRLAEKFAQLYGLIPLLSCVQHGSEIQHNLLPTWIPRWDESYTSTVLRPLDIDDVLRSTTCHQRTHTVAPGGRYVRVKGRKVSTISSTLQFSSTTRLFGDLGNHHQTQKLLSFFGDRNGQVMLSFTLRAGVTSRFEPEDAEWEEKDLADFIAFVRSQEPEVVSKLRDTQPGQGDENNFKTVAMLACKGKKLVFDESDHLALAPEATHIGDWVCILEDGDIPFVLRPHQGHFYLVGECYLYDYMGGRLIGSDNSARARAALAEQTFEIH
ncbi:heterokaryon incompatibility protein-domain-containing protein [Cladorrhinum sp. PSN259]|nr:heterokaryon incompatibility protein-domain-containing protein [Cladorrhinum sp. PSN259]